MMQRTSPIVDADYATDIAMGIMAIRSATIMLAKLFWICRFCGKTVTVLAEVHERSQMPICPACDGPCLFAKSKKANWMGETIA